MSFNMNIQELSLSFLGKRLYHQSIYLEWLISHTSSDWRSKDKYIGIGNISSTRQYHCSSFKYQF